MEQIEFNYCYKQDRRTFSGHSFGPGNYVSVKKVREIRWFHSIRLLSKSLLLYLIGLNLYVQIFVTLKKEYACILVIVKNNYISEEGKSKFLSIIFIFIISP